MRERLPALVAALWWGSLSSIGFLAVPLLFAHLPTPAMAGTLAAKLFAAQTWVSVVCCMGLLLISRPKMAVTPYPWARAAMFSIANSGCSVPAMNHSLRAASREGINALLRRVQDQVLDDPAAADAQLAELIALLRTLHGNAARLQQQATPVQRRAAAVGCHSAG